MINERLAAAQTYWGEALSTLAASGAKYVTLQMEQDGFSDLAFFMNVKRLSQIPRGTNGVTPLIQFWGGDIPVYTASPQRMRVMANSEFVIPGIPTEYEGPLYLRQGLCPGCGDLASFVADSVVAAEVMATLYGVRL